MNVEANAIKIDGEWHVQIVTYDNGNPVNRLAFPMTPKASIGQIVDLERVLNAFSKDGSKSDVLASTGSLFDFLKEVDPMLKAKKTLGELEAESPDGFKNH